MFDKKDERPEGPDETVYQVDEPITYPPQRVASPLEVARATISAQAGTIKKLQQANITALHTIAALMEEKKALQDWHDSHL